MTVRTSCFLCLLGALIVAQGEANWEWKAAEGPGLERAGLGFVFRGEESCFQSDAEGLTILTEPQQSAWLEWPFVLSQPGARLQIDLDVSAESDPGAAAILLSSGNKGLFSWLWEKNYLRVSTDSKNNHQYFPQDVNRTNNYRLVIDGTQVSISVNGRLVFTGKLDEPLKEAVLSIGDMSHGGGKLTVSGIKIDGNLKEPRFSWLSWRVTPETSRQETFVWPGQANALVLSIEYQSEAQRGGMFYVICHGSYGRRLLAVAPGHDPDSIPVRIRSERFFLLIPEETESLQFLQESLSTGFVLSEAVLIPASVIVESREFQRASGMAPGLTGQSFILPELSRLAGFAIPFSRSFAAEKGEYLQVRLGEEESTIAAETVPREFGGFALYLAETPQTVKGSTVLTLTPNQTEQRYFGWYEYEYSALNPYPGGEMRHEARWNKESDLTFFVFSGFRSFFPAAPFQLGAVPGDEKITLDWTKVPGVHGYTLRVKRPGSDQFEILLSETRETSFVHEGLRNGETYSYRVSATNAAGEGPDSEEVQAVPVGLLRLVSASARRIHGSAGTYDVELKVTEDREVGENVPVEPRSGRGLRIVARFNKMLASGQAAVIGGQVALAGTPVCEGNELSIELDVENAQTVVLDLQGTAAQDGSSLSEGRVGFRLLRGDVDGNGVVDQKDFQWARAKIGRAANGESFRCDWDGSGEITAADILNIRHAMGSSVP